MERVLGIGGYFMRAVDPAALGAWSPIASACPTKTASAQKGPTVSAFNKTNNFWSPPPRHFNFPVTFSPPPPGGRGGVGRFGWVTDPEGNRVELWQPA